MHFVIKSWSVHVHESDLLNVNVWCTLMPLHPRVLINYSLHHSRTISSFSLSLSYLLPSLFISCWLLVCPHASPSLPPPLSLSFLFSQGWKVPLESWSFLACWEGGRGEEIIIGLIFLLPLPPYSLPPLASLPPRVLSIFPNRGVQWYYRYNGVGGRVVHPSLEKETQEALQQRQGRESDGRKMAAKRERGDRDNGNMGDWGRVQ